MTSTTSADSTQTVVLVHGAFVDGSSWGGVIAELENAGIDVVAPPNLLRGIGVDAGYLSAFVEALGRPTVLVGHSYAGAVITQAGSTAKGVTGLVYVAAFAPEEHESLGAINARYPDPLLSGALRTFNYTNERGEQGTELLCDRASYKAAICADLPDDVADLLARTQRPAAFDCFTSEITGTPAWKTLPSWAIVATSDHAIQPDAERDMAKRAGSETVEIDASHAVAGSHAAEVAEVITRAAKATGA